MGDLPTKKRRHPCLWLLQTMWLIEVAVLIGYTMIAMFFLDVEYLAVWRDIIPLLAALIGGQGAVAFGGPLLADKIHNGNNN